MDKNEITALSPVAARLGAREPVVWRNPGVVPFDGVKHALPLGAGDIDGAERRLLRFAPFIAEEFPETAGAGGIIESPLEPVPGLRKLLNERYGASIAGTLLLKRDDSLPISGSVKARGGIYEVLLHTETLAESIGLLRGDYRVFCSDSSKKLLGEYSIHVGSTGNLGLSIGIMSAALGYRAVVHMSSDARRWKKELLRSRGVDVREYGGDYGEAVRRGRELAESDSRAYFVDDEKSQALFLGYAVAARRLRRQLEDMGVTVDNAHPLAVYIPCGVGGAPGGITFGLKHEFGDDVYCIFAEPVEAPCMLLGVCTGLHSAVRVQDIGLSGQTAADGLAVGRPSGFVGEIAEKTVSGMVTVPDAALFDLLRGLYGTEGIFIEPSACAGIYAAARCVGAFPELANDSATHIVWATGGSMVPMDERGAYLDTYSFFQSITA